MLAARRERIVDAHAELCFEQGYRGTTVTEIVRRAEVARGSFYEVFASRDESFIALISRAGDALLAAVDESGTREDGREELLEGSTLAALVWLAENPAFASVLLFDASAGPPVAQKMQLELFDALAVRLAWATRGRPNLAGPLEQMLVGGAVAILRRLLLANELDRAPSLAGDLNSLMSSPCAAREERSL